MKSPSQNGPTNNRMFFTSIYLNLQIILTSGSFVSVWIIQFFLVSPLNLIERLSFKVIDPPWLPSNISAVPILGKHFFGDWQLDTVWAIDPNNPYISEVMPSRTPPLGLFLTSILGLPGIVVGWYLFTFLTFFLVYKFFKICTNGLNISQKLILAIFVFVFNAAIIVSLDRGSSHVLAFTCVGLSIYYFKVGNLRYATIYYLIATAFKPQFIVMLLILIGIQKTSRILWLLVAPIFINIMFMFAFYHPVRESFIGYLKGSSVFTTGGGDQNAAGLIADSVSIVGFISRIIEAINGWGSSIEWIQANGVLFLMIALLWLLIVVLTLVYAKVSWRIRVVLVLSSMSLVLPSSGIYTLGWSFVAVLLIALEEKNQQAPIKKKLDFEDICVLVILLSAVTPTFLTDFLFDGISRRLPLVILLFPTLLLLVIKLWLPNFMKKEFE